MTPRGIPLLALLLATVAGAQEPQDESSRQVPFSDRSITRRVDDLLRASGSKLSLDQDRSLGSSHLRTETNRVHYHTRTRDQRLVRIEIEPIGQETTASRLAATFLTVLQAVETVDEGMHMAELLSREIEKDGLTRSVALGNGMKLMKEKRPDATVRYIIAL